MKIKSFVSLSLVVSLVFVIGNVAVAQEDPLLTHAKKAKVNWEAAKGKTLHVITPSFYAMDYMGTKQAPLFEKISGAKVVWEFFPPEEAKLKSRVDLSSGAGQIDIPFTPYPRIVEYVSSGWLEPLNKYLNDPQLTDLGWYDLGDFLPVYFNASRIGGEQYAFATTHESAISTYRKDVFRKMGLQYPQSFDDLYEVLPKINNPPQYATALRSARGPGVIPYEWIAFFRGFGGKLFKDYPTDFTPTVNTPEGIAGTQAYVDMFQWAPLAAKNWGWPDKLNAAQQGLIATMIIAPSDFPFQMEDPAKSKTAGKWEYAPVPYGSYGRWPYVWTAYFPVNASSKNKEAAWLLIEFLTSSKAVEQRESGERVSAWNKVVRNDSIMGTKGPWVIDWEMALKVDLSVADPNVIPPIPEYGEYADAIGVRVNQAITGELDVKTAMDKLQKDFEKVFAGKF